MEPNKNTVVVNLFAGPGAGKTTCAWEIASKLKKLGYVTEYVSEYAKELVWDNKIDLLDGSLENQSALFAEQKHRIDRLIGKVDFIVTDSPILLSSVYLKETNSDFKESVTKSFGEYNNFCIFIQRGRNFESTGRIHNKEESIHLDNNIKSLLQENDIYFGTYNYRTIDLSIQNMCTTFNKVNAKSHSRDSR